MLLKALSHLRQESGFWLLIAVALIASAFFVPPVQLFTWGSLTLYLPAALFTAGVVLLIAPPSEKRSIGYFLDQLLQRKKEERNHYRGPWDGP